MTTASQAPVTGSLWFLSIFYGGMICIAGGLGSKLVALGPLAMEAGIFAFLMLVTTVPVMLVPPGQLLAKVILSAVLSPVPIYGLVAISRRLDRASTAIVFFKLNRRNFPRSRTVVRARRRTW